MDGFVKASVSVALVLFLLLPLVECAHGFLQGCRTRRWPLIIIGVVGIVGYVASAVAIVSVMGHDRDIDLDVVIAVLVTLISAVLMFFESDDATEEDMREAEELRGSTDAQERAYAAYIESLVKKRMANGGTPGLASDDDMRDEMFRRVERERTINAAKVGDIMLSECPEFSDLPVPQQRRAAQFLRERIAAFQ